MRKILIFDTTLRDGEQSPGATMTYEEKILLAQQLEDLGVDVIEAGFPATSQGDFESVKSIAGILEKAQIAGLSRCVEKDIARCWEAIKDAKNPRLHLVLATSPLHMQYKLCKTPDQVLEMGVKAVTFAKSLCPNVEFSAEDASRSELPFLVKIFEAVIDAGATTINIPDTVGYAMPEEFGARIKYLIDNIRNKDKAVFSVHCHNDLGLGVANTLAAVKAGAGQVEVTLSGIGERAGNAALEEVVMSIHTRADYFNATTNIDTKLLYPVCRSLSLIIAQPISANKAITGANAFAHESGIHQDGMLKHRETYEIITPESVGRTKSELVLGKHSGRNATKNKLEGLGYKLTDDQVTAVTETIKRLADRKTQIFDEDIEAVVLEEIYRIPDYFRLANIAVQCSDSAMPPTAAIALEIDGTVERLANFGVGPIDAVFNVLATLSKRKPTLESYIVSAVTEGTDAQGEVSVKLIENGMTAIGRSADPDVITASAKAYINALNRLHKKEQEKKENS